MKFMIAVLVTTSAVLAGAQQDLSSSNRDSTQNGVLSGTTTNSMRDDYGTHVPSTQQVAPSQTSAKGNPVNTDNNTLQAQRVPPRQQLPAQEIPAQPMNGVPAGTTSGTTQSPLDTSGQ